MQSLFQKCMNIALTVLICILTELIDKPLDIRKSINVSIILTLTDSNGQLPPIAAIK